MVEIVALGDQKSAENTTRNPRRFFSQLSQVSLPGCPATSAGRGAWQTLGKPHWNDGSQGKQ
jgi:hypothetical protein